MGEDLAIFLTFYYDKVDMRMTMGESLESKARGKTTAAGVIINATRRQKTEAFMTAAAARKEALQSTRKDQICDQRF